MKFAGCCRSRWRSGRTWRRSRISAGSRSLYFQFVFNYLSDQENTMAQPVDPNEVLMTGENSFIRLSADGGKTHTSRVSHWRVLWCPAGAGHAMFLQSPLIQNRVQIYSDNMAVARWLPRPIETA